MKLKAGDRLVFIGDSVTDMGRKRENEAPSEGLFEPLGTGYPQVVSGLLNAVYPDVMVRITNVGISGNTVLDLKWKLIECKDIKGIRGSFVAGWFGGFFKLERFALGRMQFQIITIDRDYEKYGVKLVGGVSRVIDVHIPKDGTPLDKESCEKSYAMAREFFKEEVGENAPFVCHSWLLFPENKNLLSPRSNLYRFFSEYDIVDFGYDEGGDLWRLFDTNEVNPYRLPADTSMRRAYIEHLKNGGRVGWGFGIKID